MNRHHVVKSVLHKAKFLRQATKRYCDWLITETYSTFSLPITFSHEGQCPRYFGSTVSLVKKTRRSICNVEKRLFKIVTVNLTVSANLHGFNCAHTSLRERQPIPPKMADKTSVHNKGQLFCQPIMDYSKLQPIPPKMADKTSVHIKDNCFASQSWCRTQNIHLLFIK